MLVLPIKKKWYDMILSGEKREEYRAYSPYWIKRFCNLGILQHIRGDVYKAKRYTHKIVKFRNGYSSYSPSFTAEIRLGIGCGKPEWGAKTGEKYLILTIVKVIDDDTTGAVSINQNELARQRG